MSMALKEHGSYLFAVIDQCMADSVTAFSYRNWTEILAHGVTRDTDKFANISYGFSLTMQGYDLVDLCCCEHRVWTVKCMVQYFLTGSIFHVASH